MSRSWRIDKSEFSSALASRMFGAIEAIKLARSARQACPELVGQHCSISVSVEGGGGICIIPLEVP
jgi:hypothetical protein